MASVGVKGWTIPQSITKLNQLIILYLFNTQSVGVKLNWDISANHETITKIIYNLLKL